MSLLADDVLLSLLIHMLAAVLWLGGVIFQSLVVLLPTTALDRSERSRLLLRAAPLQLLALVVLLPTGVYNTINNPVTLEKVTSWERAELLRSTPYGTALFGKHILVIMTTVVTALATVLAARYSSQRRAAATPTAGGAARLSAVSRVLDLPAVLPLLVVLNLLINAALAASVSYMIFTLH